MATYTTNYNLEKPEASDPFGDFRQSYNDNMDIIDQNLGGGGGGGHTIVDPSGTDMPAEGKLQFTGGVTVTDDSVNGKTVVDISGGGGNVYGAFIDTNRVLTTGTYNQSFSYTATEDCCVVTEWVSPQNDSAYFYIDGKRVFTNYASSSVDAGNISIFLKSGQTLTGSTAYNSTKNYTVYGLTQGSQGIFAPVIYSDTERVIGVWRDNKPLYQKTISVPHGTMVSVNDWTAFSGFTDVDKLVETKIVIQNQAQTESRALYPRSDYADYVPRFEVVSGNICWYTNTNSFAFYAWDWFITFQYTKTTDVAGSGDYTTLGIPSVHYDGNEKVIGTYFGATLYEKTIKVTSVTSGNNDIAHGIANVDKIIGSKATFFSTANNSTPIPNGNLSSSWALNLADMGTTTFRLSIGSSWVSYFNGIDVTLQYTKTS